MRKLEELTIKGFKSIREHTLELDRLNVFIGGNGVGKSNLIGVFRFLHEVINQRLAKYTAIRGGADPILRFGRKTTPKMEFFLKFTDENASHTYQLRIEGFVKELLVPMFAARDLHLTPIILMTKKIKSGGKFKGGVTSYVKMRADLVKLLSDTGALVTTMIDYYGLPSDTPGMADRPVSSSANRVRHVEEATYKDLGSPRNLIPFLALHEFEALLFADPVITAAVIPAPEKASELIAIAGGLAPEDINEHVDSAPSKRLLKVCPTFKKTLHGPVAAERIGLAAIRSCCPHFDSWVIRLDQFAAS